MKYSPKISARLIHLLSLLAALRYLAQAWRYAHTQASVLDEGLYLYKGWLFASGQFRPFQDYGVWTNHMPLSFLIPGYVQVWFGPGLRTGRMFALALAALTLLGLWITVRRVAAGRHRSLWAALALWAVALNPAMIKIFSVQASQGLAACMIVWVLALTAGRERPAWQLVLGAALAGAVPLTRINLTPVLPLTLAYIFWQHGKRNGLWAAAAGLLVFLGGHALYWPGILRMWAPYFPQSLTPFLDPFRRAPGVRPVWRPEIGLSSRVLSFWQGVRFHFVSLLGVLGLALLWPRREDWHSRAQFRLAVFGVGLFGVLLLAHGWAALGQSYCVFCFPVYLSFFSLIGLVLLAATFVSWRARAPRWLPVLILLIGLGVGYGSFDTLGAALVQQPGVLRVLKSEVPRLGGAGTVPLWGLIANKFGMEYEEVVRQTQYWSRIGVATLIGLLAASGVLILARRGYRFEGRAFDFGGRAWSLALLAGLVLSPTAALGGGYRTYDCSGDVIAAYETAGAQLAAAIPPRARVYWGTGNSPVPLLYLPDIRIFPPQLNGGYSFKQGGEPDALLKIGHWNQALAERWAQEADVILLDRAAFKDPAMAWLVALVESGAFRELPPTQPVHPCDGGSQILIFVRESTGTRLCRMCRMLVEDRHAPLSSQERASVFGSDHR